LLGEVKKILLKFNVDKDEKNIYSSGCACFRGKREGQQGEKIVKLNGYDLVCTCGHCPEQYDVFKEGVQVGYLRLRHGYFIADCGLTTVYESRTQGDGGFEEDEREYHLTEAVKAIHDKLMEAK